MEKIEGLLLLWRYRFGSVFGWQGQLRFPHVWWTPHALGGASATAGTSCGTIKSEHVEGSDTLGNTEVKTYKNTSKTKRILIQCELWRASGGLSRFCQLPSWQGGILMDKSSLPATADFVGFELDICIIKQTKTLPNSKDCFEETLEARKPYQEPY